MDGQPEAPVMVTGHSYGGALALALLLECIASPAGLAFARRMTAVSIDLCICVYVYIYIYTHPLTHPLTHPHACKGDLRGPACIWSEY